MSFLVHRYSLFLTKIYANIFFFLLPSNHDLRLIGNADNATERLLVQVFFPVGSLLGSNNREKIKNVHQLQ